MTATRRFGRAALGSADVQDALLAAVLAVTATVFTLTGGYSAHDERMTLVSGLLLTLPLAVRRRWPVTVFVTVQLMLVVEAWLLGATEGVAVLFGMLLATYTVAAHTDRRRALGGLVVATLVMAYSNSRSGHPFDDAAFGLTLLLGAWAVGRVVWSRQQYVDRLAEQAEELRRTREAGARALLAEERARTARDVHDIVAHSVSVMVVQAEAGEALLPDVPENARAAQSLRAIQASGRATLHELRRLLGALEPDDAPSPNRDPAPGLADAAALVERVKAAGADVDLRITGDVALVPDGVGLAAYRVLQESLTNALRHAHGSPVSIRVDVAPDQVVVEVRNSAGTRHGSAGESAGRGLVGMRERVRIYGGTLTATRTDDGFVVRAVIPAGQVQAATS